MKNDAKIANKPKLALNAETLKHLSVKTGVQAGPSVRTASLANCAGSYRVCSM